MPCERRADLDRVNPHRPRNILEDPIAEIDELFLQLISHLPVSVLGKTDSAGLCSPFQARGNIDAVAHQIAVALFDDVSQMNADPEDDAAILGHAVIALDHGVLNFNGAAHGIDDAAELDDRAVAGALDYTPVMH